MSAQHAAGWSRREFLAGLTRTGTAGLLGLHAGPGAVEPPPETSTLRIGQSPAICFAPPYVAAEQLFQAEGFVDVQYVKRPLAFETIVSGEAAFATSDVGSVIASLDKGQPIVVLVGLHPGCYELFGTEQIHSIRDLAGKKVAIPGLHSPRHRLLSAMLAYVGVDPRRDIDWVTEPAGESMQLLAEGKIDAFLGCALGPQELRARGVGHVVVSTTVDRPWSQYFCCFVAANREFVRQHPIAPKRALRAILKAADVCALEPERAARFLVAQGFAPRYDYMVQTLKELPYLQWREYTPEDMVRFNALRLHEVGMIKTTPQKLIEQGTDWCLLTELKKELTG
jgi:NitT/TauT family transport system substrate-binding protein